MIIYDKSEKQLFHGPSDWSEEAKKHDGICITKLKNADNEEVMNDNFAHTLLYANAEMSKCNNSAISRYDPRPNWVNFYLYNPKYNKNTLLTFNEFKTIGK